MEESRDIEKLVEEKTARLIEEAQLSGRVDPIALRELKNLAALAGIRKAIKPVERPSHLPVIIAASATLAIVSFLLFHRLSSAEILLDAKVNQLGFDTGDTDARTLLNEPWSLTSLSIEQASELTVPTGDSKNPKLQLPAESAYVTFNIPPADANSSHIILNALPLNAGTRVDFSRRSENEYELRLTPPPQQSLSIKGTLAGRIEAAYPEMPVKTISLEAPQPLIASVKDKQLILNLKPARYSFGFAPNIPIKALRLFQTQEYVDPEQNLLREVSSIQQGTLFQESLNGEQVQLRTGEDLHLDGLSGLLRSADIHAVSDSALSLQFSGSAKDVSVGHGESARSLMPATLEWLSKKHELTLFWGASLYVIGLILTFWNWVKKSE